MKKLAKKLALCMASAMILASMATTFAAAKPEINNAAAQTQTAYSDGIPQYVSISWNDTDRTFIFTEDGVVSVFRYRISSNAHHLYKDDQDRDLYYPKPGAGRDLQVTDPVKRIVYHFDSITLEFTGSNFF